MKRVDILYLVEHVARELDVACAIGQLIQQNHSLSVHIRSLVFNLDRTLRTYRPRMLVVPYFYSRHDFGIEDLLVQFPGVPCVNLAFEQVVAKANAPLKCPQDQVARDHVLYASSGELYDDFLQSHGVDPRHIERTGSLPMALYREPYRQYYVGSRDELARRHGLDPRRPWIFFPENYRAAFFSEREIQQRVRQGFDPHEIRNYQRFAWDSFAEVMNWCARSADLGPLEIIIRPRPATTCQAFAEAFRQVAGQPPGHIHFIKHGSIRRWNLISDLVVSSYSTSVIEASLVPKPVFLLLPEPIPSFFHAPWHALAPQLSSEEQFRRQLASVSTAALPVALSAWAEQRLLAGGDPLRNAAEFIAAVCTGHRTAPTLPAQPLATTIRRRTKRSLRRWRNRLRESVGWTQPQRNRHHEQDSFSSEDVRRLANRWRAVLLPIRKSVA